MVVCIQNCYFSTGIASLYGSSSHLWFCAFITATLWPELIVSMGPRPHLSFCAWKTSWLAPELLCLHGLQPSFVVFACKTATLEPEILVSIGPSPHLWFLHTKQRLWDQNFMSLLVPDLTYVLCIQNSNFWIRITNLYRYQTSSVDSWIQNRVLRSRMTFV